MTLLSFDFEEVGNLGMYGVARMYAGIMYVEKYIGVSYALESFSISRALTGRRPALISVHHYLGELCFNFRQYASKTVWLVRSAYQKESFWHSINSCKQ